jgi:DNA-directed RNA polymerase specialized sigma24 family protein
MAKKKGGNKVPNTNRGAKAFLAWLDGVQDPRERYRWATRELERHQRAATQLSSVRASAAADAYRDGASVRSLARQLGLSPSRVHQLIHDADVRTR